MTAPVTQPDAATRVSRWVLVATGTAVALAAAVVPVVLVSPASHGTGGLHTGTSHYVVTVTVENPRIGTTAVEIDVAGRTGGVATPAAVEIEAVMPLMGHATPPVPAAPVGAGRYRAEGVPLMMTGSWELLVSIDFTGGVDHLTLPLSVSG